MNISEITSAMQLTIKLEIMEDNAEFKKGSLLRIQPSHDELNFFVIQYGAGIQNNKDVLCKVSLSTANYLNDLFSTEQYGDTRYIFVVDNVEREFIEVQSYSFQAITEYKTPIYILISDSLFQEGKQRGLYKDYESMQTKFYKDYVWTQLGQPAVFCQINKISRKKSNPDDIQIVGNRNFLNVKNTVRGLLAEKEVKSKKFSIPLSIYLAPEIKFVTPSDDVDINDALHKDLNEISNPATYFSRWEAYDRLSDKLREKESEEFGEIAYSSFNSVQNANGCLYEFKIKEQFIDSSFLGKEICVFKQDNYEKQFKREQCVGKLKAIYKDKISTFLEGYDDTVITPEKGVLKLYTAGDKYIMKRRNIARERMLLHSSPIRYIVALIETGTSKYDTFNPWGHYDEITTELKRNFKKADNLNKEQKEALKIAINTPDIAVIQGPPGTGKTTVIKAICERFREIFEHEKGARPKILISSFQNEAVDNAISAPLPGDIPAYRKVAKRISKNGKEQYQKSLDKWYSELKHTIESMIDDKVAKEFEDNKLKLHDEFLSYKNAGEPKDKGKELIKHYLSFIDIEYPENIISKAEKILSEKNGESVEFKDETSLIEKRLNMQRLTSSAFEDDGIQNARKLYSFISLNEELSISDDIVNSIKNVCLDTFSDEDFNNYINAVNRLKQRFCKSADKIDHKNENTINECILELSNYFSNHYSNTFSSLESKKSIILSEFLRNLELDYEFIVEKYSMTTAATCQTSLDLGEPEQTYDLVIIDEAARANPLDLFIPMSMGKKIILVGDHKQLPHMLEPDVLKLLLDDPKFNDIPEIEKSLFERLFEMFSLGQKTKAIPLTKQFRMHPEICRFVSDSFYDGILTTDQSISSDVKACSTKVNNGKPLAFINIPLSKGGELGGVSKYRPAEIEIVVNDVRNILESENKNNRSIGVITFYSAQAQIIKEKLDELLNGEESSRVEVGTVDAFQGKEYDYVLLSCVRSNPSKNGEPHNVGFLEKPNRLCVAFSRAIRQLSVYGDAETLGQIPCFSRLYDICAVKGEGFYHEY